MTLKLIIAGGGTGGHIFPGVAVAEEWQKRGGEVLFVGTELGQEKDLVPKAGFRVAFLKVGQLKGKGLPKKIMTVLGLPLAVLAALKLLVREKANLVLGIGGYASAAVCLASPLRGIRMAVMDQNVVPGLTNRILGRLARRVFVSFEKTRDFFSQKKVVVSGNPVRTGITHAPYVKPTGRMTVFVFGGSQGAVTLNRVFTEALAQLADMKERLEIYHQAGATDEDELKTFYRNAGFKSTVQRFFNNMNGIYAQSHLVIARAGAGTVTELAITGRPAILVPYPFAADDHQKKNAEFFSDRDAAWLIEQKDLNAQDLTERMRNMIENPAELERKAENMRRLGIPGAARIIVDELQQMLRTVSGPVPGDKRQATGDRR